MLIHVRQQVKHANSKSGKKITGILKQTFIPVPFLKKKSFFGIKTTRMVEIKIEMLLAELVALTESGRIDSTISVLTSIKNHWKTHYKKVKTFVNQIGGAHRIPQSETTINGTPRILKILKFLAKHLQ